MIWDQLTSPEIAEINRNIPVILPVAATEQHGAHLPLATDRMIGEFFCHQLHNEIPDHVLILPPVSVGCSAHHMEFSGSLTLRHGTFLRQVKEVLASAAHHGFKNLIVFNSHGGNQGIGQVITELFGNKHPECRIVFATWWKIAGEPLFALNETGEGGVGHAGEFETSLMLKIAPHLVRQEMIGNKQNRENFTWATGDLLRGPRASLFQTMKTMTPNGVFGEARKVSAGKGEKITEIVINAMKEIIFDLIESSKNT